VLGARGKELNNFDAKRRNQGQVSTFNRLKYFKSIREKGSPILRHLLKEKNIPGKYKRDVVDYME